MDATTRCTCLIRPEHFQHVITPFRSQALNVMLSCVMMQFVFLQLANVNFCEAVERVLFCPLSPCHLVEFWWVQLRLPLSLLSTCLLLSGQDWPAGHLLRCCYCSNSHQSPLLQVSYAQSAGCRCQRLQNCPFTDCNLPFSHIATWLDTVTATCLTSCLPHQNCS